MRSRFLPLAALVALLAATTYVLMLRRVDVPAVSASGEGVWWPRFPPDATTRQERALAVLYNSDSIGPHTTLARLGYPERRIFRLHSEHPRLGVLLASCPANRYSGETSVLESPLARPTWTALGTDSRFDWIELASQGYTHSPPGDTNLNHHEFSPSQGGCNIDHSTLDDASYVDERMRLIRETYRRLAIEDERMVVFKFPGLTSTAEARRAAIDAGFIASLGRSGWLGTPGLEGWLEDSLGREMIELPSVDILGLFARSDELEAGILAGKIPAEEIAGSPWFLEAVDNGRNVVEEIAGGGGLLNLSDEWSDTFESFGGTYPRYMVLDAVLDHVESVYGGRVWYPRPRELVLWLAARHLARSSISRGAGEVEVELELPGHWAAASSGGLSGASIIVEVPPAWSSLSGVRIAAGDGSWRALEPDQFWLERRGAVVVFHLTGRDRLRITGS